MLMSEELRGLIEKETGVDVFDKKLQDVDEITLIDIGIKNSVHQKAKVQLSLSKTDNCFYNTFYDVMGFKSDKLEEVVKNSYPLSKDGFLEAMDKQIEMIEDIEADFKIN